MDVNDYGRLLDHLENNGAIRRDGTRNEFVRVATSPRVIRGSAPSRAKARAMGTNGKLGHGRILSTTASDHTRRISSSAESQVFGRYRSESAASDIADILERFK